MAAKSKTRSKKTFDDKETLPPAIIEQEELRKSIDGKRLLKEREVAVKELQNIDKDLKKVKNTRQRPTAIADAFNRSEIRRKVLVDTIKSIDSLLNKILPDRKVHELSDPKGRNPLSGLASELAGTFKK